MSSRPIYIAETSATTRALANMLDGRKLLKVRKKVLMKAANRMRKALVTEVLQTYGHSQATVKYIRYGMRKNATATWVTTSHLALFWQGTKERKVKKGWGRGAMRQTGYVDRAIAGNYARIVADVEKELSEMITANFK